jgi:eukaryotic-like serine/threonine-protein kinase
LSTTPHRLGKYEFRQFLGKGNIGEVWRAYDLTNNCDVAIKTVYTDLQRADAQFLTRFMTDGQVLVTLRHPHLVSVLEVNVTRQEQANTLVAYMTMDYTVGSTLATYLQQTSYQGKLPSLLEIIYFLTCLGQALDQAKQQGIVHGNLTPSNIFLNQRQTLNFCGGEPLLADTGLVQILGSIPAAYSKMPFYLSPEQAQGNTPSQHSDVYSLGVILYELFTGLLPFQGEDSAAIISQHIYVHPTPPALINAHISPDVSKVIVRALAKDPTTRYSSVSLLANAFTEASMRQKRPRFYHNEGIVPIRQENSFLGVAHPPSTPDISTSSSAAFYRPNPPSSGGLIKPAFISPTSAPLASRTQSPTTIRPPSTNRTNTPPPLSTPLPLPQEQTHAQAAHTSIPTHTPDASPTLLPPSQMQEQGQTHTQTTHSPTPTHTSDVPSTLLPPSQTQEQGQTHTQTTHSPTPTHTSDVPSTLLPPSQTQEQGQTYAQATHSPAPMHAPNPAPALTPSPLSQEEPQVTSQSDISQTPQALDHVYPNVSFSNNPFTHQPEQSAPNANDGSYLPDLNQQVTPPPPASTLQSTPTPSPLLSQVQEQRKKISPFVYVGLIAAILIIVAAGLVSITILLNYNDNKLNTVINGNGHIFFQDSSLHNDQLRIMLENVSSPPNGKTYFAWLLDPDQNSKALGAITTLNGGGMLIYQEDKQHTNLISIMQSIVITTEDSGTTPQTPSDNKVYLATLNPKLSDGLKSLLYATPGLPPQQSIVATILDTIHSIDDKAGSIVETLHQDEALAMRQAIRILELLEGSKMARSSGDLPEQYESQLSVDVGLTSPQGYLDILEVQIKQLEPLVTDTKVAQQHLVSVKSALDDLRSWLQKMRDTIVQLLKTTDLQSSASFSIALQLKQISADSYTGHIIPPNSGPQPIPGSAGALQAYTEAQYMAMMDIQPV